MSHKAKVNVIVFTTILLVCVGGAVVYARSKDKKDEQEFQKVIEPSPEKRTRNAKRYRKLSRAEAKHTGFELADLLTDTKASTKTVRQALAGLLMLQRKSFIEVYWYTSQKLWEAAKCDLVTLLQTPRYQAYTEANRVLTALVAVVKKRYVGKLVAPPTSILPDWFSKYVPLPF